ncbi:hypothetical protein ACFSCV_18695 [Methylopila henanensis]|uniref:Uncharacterized protein n=1 Tax=Methylopila henanensis TaxID=873516 RepID=A0ABW4KCQ6_9HYPH
MTARAFRASAPGARAAALVVCLSAALAACAPPRGDFGRAEPSLVNDRWLPLAGRKAAQARGEPVSSYRYTDNEKAMRALGWAVVMPAHEGQRIGAVLAELRRTRILPQERARIDKADYVRALLRVDYRSSVARYARLQEDIEADTARVEPFFQAASRVAEDDRVRLRALAAVPEVEPDEVANAEGRVDENRLLEAWVQIAFEERVVAYRYALDRLVLETPDRASVSVEAALARLESVLRSLRPAGPPRGVFKG